MSSPYRLAVKVSKVVNHCKNSYERKAAPVLHTWEWKDIAISDNRTALEEYAEKLPMEFFDFGKREYRIYRAGEE